MAEERKKRDQRNFQVTLDKVEWARYQTVLNIAQTRFIESAPVGDAEFKDAWVVRRLIGFLPPDDLITQNEIDYFFGRAELEEKSLEGLGEASTEYGADDFDYEEENKNQNEDRKAA